MCFLWTGWLVNRQLLEKKRWWCLVTSVAQLLAILSLCWSVTVATFT